MKEPEAKRSHKKAPVQAPAKPAPMTEAHADALAVAFVRRLNGGSEVHREQLRRMATAAIYGRRQALDALCRLRSKGLQREDLAGIGRRELCGEWSALWKLVERRSGEIEADKREAALAGDPSVKAMERTDLLLAETVKMESLLYEEQQRVKELEGGAMARDLRSQIAALDESNRNLRRDLLHAQLDLKDEKRESAEYALQLEAMRDRSPLRLFKRWLMDLHAWGRPS